MSFRPVRFSALSVAAVLAVSGVSTAAANGETPTPAPSPSATAPAAPGDPLSSQYPADFKLTPLSADPISDTAAPNYGAYQSDPAYGTHVYRATKADESGRMRHEYSRRQAFNAD